MAPARPKSRDLPEPGCWCVYLLRCRDGSLYTGATNRLAQRVARHDAGRGAAYTRSRRPITLVYWESAKDRSSALRREATIKRLSRAQKVALVEEAVGLGPATCAAKPSRRPAAAARAARSAP
ncbi:MAG: GIY-YIG nuclease family protein [Deltaproteobacteria bacterium]|nr:GIY-YIG nuclease family protein [Deltaproteobacteria bacterium]